jgi:nucleoside-diphosphate-sugar epimerase
MASKILFIGGTGYIGKFIVEASAKAGHPTFVLVRESTLSNPAKSVVIDNFMNLGVNFLVVSPFLFPFFSGLKK